MPPTPNLWRDTLMGREGPVQLGLIFWAGVAAQVALAQQAGLALRAPDALVAVWVLVLGLVAGLYVRGQKRRAGRDLRLVPLLLLFTLPVNVAEGILNSPLIQTGWKAAAAAALLISLWQLRDLEILWHRPGDGPKDPP